jgi:hypothetical protein
VIEAANLKTVFDGDKNENRVLPWPALEVHIVQISKSRQKSLQLLVLVFAEKHDVAVLEAM